MDGFPMKATEAVCLGASLAFSGIFYYLYKKSWAALAKLDVGVNNIYQHDFTYVYIVNYFPCVSTGKERAKL